MADGCFPNIADPHWNGPQFVEFFVFGCCFHHWLPGISFNKLLTVAARKKERDCLVYMILVQF